MAFPLSSAFFEDGIPTLFLSCHAVGAGRHRERRVWFQTNHFIKDNADMTWQVSTTSGYIISSPSHLVGPGSFPTARLPNGYKIPSSKSQSTLYSINSTLASFMRDVATAPLPSQHKPIHHSRSCLRVASESIRCPSTIQKAMLQGSLFPLHCIPGIWFKRSAGSHSFILG